MRIIASQKIIFSCQGTEGGALAKAAAFLGG